LVSFSAGAIHCIGRGDYAAGVRAGKLKAPVLAGRTSGVPMNAIAMNIFPADVQRDTKIDRHEKRPAVPLGRRGNNVWIICVITAIVQPCESIGQRSPPWVAARAPGLRLSGRNPILPPTPRTLGMEAERT